MASSQETDWAYSITTVPRTYTGQTADAISPRRHQYVGHWSDWSSSTLAAHGLQTCTTGPVRPVPDKYAFQATYKQRNKQTKPHFAAGF